MKNIKSIFGLFILFISLSVFAETGNEPFTIAIDIAPNVLNLNNQGEVVTVHTDIAYGLVSTSSVYLNGVKINSWKADDRGNFVAKFLTDEVKALFDKDEIEIDFVSGEMYTLTLTGTYVDGDFWGSQDIKVIKVDPVKTGKD